MFTQAAVDGIAHNVLMPAIVLSTLNARYAHASLGLRCLRANLGDLRDDSAIVEFTLATPLEAIVERLLAHSPRLIGFGVYIWNVQQTTQVVERLKQVAPQVVLVLGGPEVSHEVASQPICRLADYVVTGWGDVTFAKLARQILHGPRPLMKVHAGEQPALDALALPYGEFSDEDIAHRHVYVEASRGCPFKCEFCLSALDKTAWPFPLDAFLAALGGLWARGARRFKFVDRTFNLKADTARAILQFFLDRLQDGPSDPPFVHFELVPDHLPASLRGPIAAFPAGSLQFEIGIQTWNPEVQRLISRRQDNAAAEANLRWLRVHTQAHLHVDLIAGLPGESLSSFAQGFDRLVALAPHEIQLGLLKRLRGAPISRHVQTHGLQFDPQPPYVIRATRDLPAQQVAGLARFARYWDLVANSGRFMRSLPLLLGGHPFARFMAISESLHASLGTTHGIALESLHRALHAAALTLGVPSAEIEAALAYDYLASGARGRLELNGRRIAGVPAAPVPLSSTLPRQRRHRAGQERQPSPG
jgi:radical SAM superfamily enzyme YgiQ (UPF0313 family)